MRRRRCWCPLVLLLVIGTVCPVARAGQSGLDTGAIDAYMRERIEVDKYASLSVGIVYDQELVWANAYGMADAATDRAATPDTIYRIGSITKVFTATLLCVLRDKGVVRLDDPVRLYLPEDVRVPSDPRGAPAITLRHLATHSSGLPRIPLNTVAKGTDPYAGYTPKQMYDALAWTRLDFPTGSRSEYSNWGMGLLGHALELAAGEPYETVLKAHLLEPLGMTSTTITLSEEHMLRYAPGHWGHDTSKEVCDWDLGCLAGCGGLASNVPDLAKFLALQMRAGRANVKPVAGGTLAEMQRPQFVDENWEMAFGLGWIVSPDKPHGPLVWHNGGTFGHTAFIGFLPKRRIGVIVLTNCGKDADPIGHWLLETARDSLPEPASGPLAAVRRWAAQQATSQPAAEQVPAPAEAPSAAAASQKAELPTGEEVLARYVEATGGREAYRSLRCVAVRGTGTSWGRPVTFRQFAAAPCRCYMRMRFDTGHTMEFGTDGGTVWQIAYGHAEVFAGIERDNFLNDAYLLEDIRWRDVYRKIECTGAAEFEGHPCHVVVLTPHRGTAKTRYFDMQTHLAIGEQSVYRASDGRDLPVRRVYGNYRRFGAFRIPTRLITTTDDYETVIRIDTIEINADIPESRFELPRKVRGVLRRQAASSAPASRPGRTAPNVVLPGGSAPM